ncbi:Uma2 family endonuclease [Actinophytocola gossypii]|uniref:Uma2 family endonuclease n=1 Tax=Actinophytocola gossypii TaxID=2812003 RepID=UPI004057BD22
MDDLEAMPDDGNRYELIDGTLYVSPAPGTRHQKVQLKLAIALDMVCPPDLHVLTAPYAVRASRSTELQPDVLVARDEDLTDKLLPVAPLLAVEVFSPSSVLNDMNNKRAAYQRLGVQSYWVIDPEELSLTVYELDAMGVYSRVASVKGGEAFEAERPFPVRVVPRELLGTLAK